ncbi:MAG: DNRLRE domain-containing protein [Bacteroidota bacterium]
MRTSYSFSLRSALALLLGLALLPAFTGCDLIEQLEEEIDETDVPLATGTVYMWIGADMDATVSCGPLTVPGCPEADNNYGTQGGLSVSFNGVGIKRSYVHFGLPTLPEGSTVDEAYFEMYHGGQNEDGQSDDITIPVTLAGAPWKPLEITYNNQPNRSTSGSSGFGLTLNSMDWSGTADIANLVQSHFDSPATNYGYVVYWGSNAGNGIEKGFYSINDYRRTRTDLGLSPRMLVKVTLPPGYTTADIDLAPTLNADSDLNPRGSGPILMVRFASGTSDWPDAWNVTRGIRR